MTNYPKWFLPGLLGVLLVLFATGVLMAPTTLDLRLDWDLGWHLPAGRRVAVAALHALCGFAMALWMGALWSVHMRMGWRRGRQRGSGLWVGLLLLGLMATAIAVYYLGDDTLGSAAAGLHLMLGLMLVPPFVWHWARGRRSIWQRRATLGQSVHRIPASARLSGSEASIQ